jgi:hypothetical protein
MGELRNLAIVGSATSEDMAVDSWVDCALTAFNNILVCVERVCRNSYMARTSICSPWDARKSLLDQPLHHAESVLIYFDDSVSSEWPRCSLSIQGPAVRRSVRLAFKSQYFQRCADTAGRISKFLSLTRPLLHSWITCCGTELPATTDVGSLNEQVRLFITDSASEMLIVSDPALLADVPDNWRITQDEIFTYALREGMHM